MSTERDRWYPQLTDAMSFPSARALHAAGVQAAVLEHNGSAAATSKAPIANVDALAALGLEHLPEPDADGSSLAPLRSW